MARKQPKTGISRSAAKAPLQDITGRYKPLCLTRNSVDSPAPTYRRKPNPLRTTPGPTVSISLPPSSPPSTSSRPLVGHAQHVPPCVPSDNLDPESDDFRLDTTAVSDSSSNADPFGFFALENKLKILRSRQQPTNPRYQPVPSPHTPVGHSDFVDPPTPSKKRNERKDIGSPISFGKYDSELDSMPGTPLIVISNKGKEKAVAEEKSIPTFELANNTPKAPAPSQKTKLRPRNARGVLDVPSRRLRRTSATTEPRKNVSHGRTREEAGRASTAELQMKTARQKSRVKRTVKAMSTAKANSSVNTDAKARQVRLDYFKKLEDYQLEKENVYVI